MYGRIGGRLGPQEVGQGFGLRFSNAATVGDFDEHPEDLAKATDCIGELILALGGRESTSPDKTFSTPSDNVPRAPSSA